MGYLWRISNHKTLSGIGGLKYAARWHSAGRPVVYLAESPAGALLEVLVHLNLAVDELPDRFTLLCVEVPEPWSVESLEPPQRRRWRENIRLTQKLGDEWLQGNRTALARVPSALVPKTYNYLLNPLNPAHEAIRIVEVFEDRYDLRLKGRTALEV